MGRSPGADSRRGPARRRDERGLLLSLPLDLLVSARILVPSRVLVLAGLLAFSHPHAPLNDRLISCAREPDDAIAPHRSGLHFRGSLQAAAKRYSRGTP